MRENRILRISRIQSVEPRVRKVTKLITTMAMSMTEVWMYA